MALDLRNDLQNALYAGFVDGNVAAKTEYLPKLLVNDPKANLKVLTSILSELESCDEFFFSVAFVTNSGVAALINTFIELQQRGIKGRLIASQYQDFTEPQALLRLISFPNIEVRIQTENNFHAKGYLFRHGDCYTAIVGSSNLTANALCVNTEWNLRVFSKEAGSLAFNLLDEFKQQFKAATVVTPDWIAQYDKIYSAKYNARVEANHLLQDRISTIHRPQPNTMQKQALMALENLRSEGRKKALLISATGTGKTYLSAFDVKKVQPKKFLFVVHRENIARAAMRTFKSVFGNSVKMGLYTGHVHDTKADFIFSTVQTMSKEANYRQFAPTHFEYIVIDEVHRAGADSYQRILKHFKPEFLLGMSATPERTDGYDIFKDFDYNIAHEIRLHSALEQDMLSPFHYYGITDITVNDVLLEDDADFNDLTSDERVKHILKYTKFYGCGRGRIKGLIFCSRVDEANKLSEKLNATGLRTIALTGDSSEDQREEAIELLESDDPENYLDYILTRDIFNEGVDIPSVNQVVMLRPTQSAIVFVQQLGRGLRKYEGKEYLTVLDFIGNYENNFMVPVALYGDSSGNKDNLRKFVSGGSSCIPGASTVNFDRIAKEKIYESINKSNQNTLNELKREYTLLKYKIGRIPSMMDFVEHGSRDPYAFIENRGSYYAFLCRAESTVFQELNKHLMMQLNFFSVEICNGKRLEELLILQALMLNGRVKVSFVKEAIQGKGYWCEDASINSAINLINGVFLTAAASKKYECSELCIRRGDEIEATAALTTMLKESTFKQQLGQTVSYAIYYFYEHNPVARYRRGFTLYEKYSRKDVCRILNWPNNDESTIYGYRVKHNTCPIFVNYQKHEDIDESTKYEDAFINRSQFHWMTRNRVTLSAPEAEAIIAYQKTGLRICLFVKQSNGESDDFYFIGDCTPFEWKELTIKNNDGVELPIVNFNFNLSDECDEDLYKYLITPLSTSTKIGKPTIVPPLEIPKETDTSNKPQTRVVSTPRIDYKKPVGELVYLPVVGEIAAGHQHFLEESISGYLPIERSRINSVAPGKYFFLIVDGDSMIGAGINSGDAVLIRRSSKINDGSIVAARIGETGTLKTLHENENGIILQPANPAYEPYYVGIDEFENGSAGFIGEAILRDTIPVGAVGEQMVEKMPEQPEGKPEESTKKVESLAEFFKSKNLEVIDKRYGGGCLWVVGNRQHLQPIIKEAEACFGALSGNYGSGRATRMREGWWTKTNK